MLIVALVFFALAAAAGATLIILSQQWWLFAVGAADPRGRLVLHRRPEAVRLLARSARSPCSLFFGVVPVAGTMFVQVGDRQRRGLGRRRGAGAFAAAVLVVNNLRDRERDAAVGKRTLAVLLGNVGTRVLYIVLMLVPFGALAFYVIFYAHGVRVLQRARRPAGDAHRRDREGRRAST